MPKRIAIFSYGLLCYLLFLTTFLYAIAFIGNLIVPRSLDAGPEGPFIRALLVNTALLGIFAVQHSVMARQWFKRAWTRIIPQPVERSTYVLFSSLALLLLFWQWQPMGGVIWNLDNQTIRSLVYALFTLGWFTVLASTFLIDHFDLFGMRQAYLYLRGMEYTPVKFKTPGIYQIVRHPLYLGWLLVFWSAPKMTAAHLLFALATTGYILIAIQLEERDLNRLYGNDYRQYRQRVPMLLPWRLVKKRELAVSGTENTRTTV
jgi:methanethiol S-methyltransferase